MAHSYMSLIAFSTDYAVFRSRQRGRIADSAAYPSQVLLGRTHTHTSLLRLYLTAMHHGNVER